MPRSRFALGDVVRAPLVTVGRTFRFEAAHFLLNHPGLCKNLHGHTYTVTIEVTGLVNPTTGMVLDFFDLKEEVNRLVRTVDHAFLNELFPGEVTTVERLVKWFHDSLAPALAPLKLSVQIQEGEGGYARYPSSLVFLQEEETE